MENRSRSCITGIFTVLALGVVPGLGCSSGAGDGTEGMGGSSSSSGGSSSSSGGSSSSSGGSSSGSGGSTSSSGGTSSGGSSAGGSSAGGSTASGGGGAGGGGGGGADLTPRCTATLTPATGVCNVIDDFEDGTGMVGGRPCPPGDGRGAGGSWDVVRPIPGMAPYLEFMATYEFAPITGGAPGSTQGIHWSGTNVDANQGASIGLSFGPCYGAAPMYTGITFWAQAAAEFDLIVGVNDALSHGEVDCHGADSAMPGTDSCYGSFRKTVTVTPTWQQFTITWSELVQASWGIPQHTLEPSKLVSLVFISTADFDVTLDDIAFVGGDASMCGAAAAP